MERPSEPGLCHTGNERAATIQHRTTSAGRLRCTPANYAAPETNPKLSSSYIGGESPSLRGAVSIPVLHAFHPLRWLRNTRQNPRRTRVGFRRLCCHSSIDARIHERQLFCGHVQQDEFAIRSGLEKPRNLGRLAVPQRGELAEFFCVAEGDDLKRYRKINLGFYQDRSKNRSQLLELNGSFTAAFFAGISHNGEMRRPNLHPLRITRKRKRNSMGNKKRRNYGQDEGREGNTHGQNPFWTDISYTSSGQNNLRTLVCPEK